MSNQEITIPRELALANEIVTVAAGIVVIISMLFGSQGFLVQIATITTLAGMSIGICLFLEQRNKSKILVPDQTNRKRTLSTKARNWMIGTVVSWLVLIILAVGGNRIVCETFSFISCTPRQSVVAGVENEATITPAPSATNSPAPTPTPYYTLKSFAVTKKGEQKIYTSNDTVALFAGETVEIKAQVQTNAALTDLDFYWFTCKHPDAPAAWGAGILRLSYTAPGSVGADCIRLEIKKGGKTIQKETLFVEVP